MEPIKTSLRIVYNIYIKTTKIEECFEAIHVSGVDPDALYTNVSLGWFVTFEGSYESLFFGNERPHFTVGKPVKITFKETNDAQPSLSPIE